jgi:hypothetical protein
LLLFFFFKCSLIQHLDFCRVISLCTAQLLRLINAHYVVLWLQGGVGLLAATTNTTTAGLGVVTTLLYTHAYTPLKRRHRWNTEVGAVVGAIPPVMGWTAAVGYAGVFSYETLFLATTLYLWQMHHFMTIAWARRTDYARAGFVMQSLGDADGRLTTTKGLAYAAAMLPLPFVAYTWGLVNPMFMVSGSLVNAALFASYIQFFRNRTTVQAKSTMKVGFLQLVLLFGALVYHLHDRDNIRAFVELERFRLFGLDRCIYVSHQAKKAHGHLCAYLFANRRDGAADDGKSVASDSDGDRNGSKTDSTANEDN